MPVAAPRKGVLIVRLLGRTVGRLDYSSHHNEMRFSYDPARELCAYGTGGRNATGSRPGPP